MLSRIRKRLPKLMLELLVLLLLVWAMEAFLTRHAASGVAPGFTAQTIQGEGFELAALRGHPAVIHFWASWCPVCELEQGTIDALADDYPFISVAMQSGSEEEVQAYLNSEAVDYPVVNDPQGELSQRYGVSAVPATFVIDANGTVRFVTRGYTSGPGIRLRLWLAGLF